MTKTPLVHLCFAALALLQQQACLAMPHSDMAYEWIERPWAIRYVLFVDTLYGLQMNRRMATRANRGPDQKSVYLDADEFINPRPLPGPGSIGRLGIAVIEFDKDGKTILGHPPQAFNARLTKLWRLVLQNPIPEGGKPFGFADWSQGIPGEVSFSPAVCSIVDDRRYQDDWSQASASGGFGCREWTAQLYDAGRPYIDVTSYGPAGPFIGEFVGWSRFTDPHKPVIGLHHLTWICLYDCPTGEKPGVIKDIRAWTAKHRFPMPERPPKQPLYPNSDYAGLWND